MKAFAIDPHDVTRDRVTGRILCHDVVAASESGRVRLSKGRILRSEDVDPLQGYGSEIHLIEMETGDVHEDEASVRLARSIAGSGVEIRDPVESQTHLRASIRGLACVRADVLEAMNALPDISVFTVYDGQPVDIGKAVGASKVTPLAVAGNVLREAEDIAREGHPAVRVVPFQGGSVGVIVRDRIGSQARRKFEASIYQKVEWFGSDVRGIRYLPDSVDAIVDAIAELVNEGVTLILAAGVNSTDPLDLTLQALARFGARTERRGVPAHPGSTCWLAYCGAVPIFGLALCGMFSQTTVLDLLLPRFLSGQPVRATDIAAFGHGGLLGKGMSARFPDYTR